MKFKVQLVGTIGTISTPRHGAKDYFIGTVFVLPPNCPAEETDKGEVVAKGRFASRKEAEDFVLMQTSILEVASVGAVN